MADYDTALDMDPDNFLGHYNRGLLRAHVGDDNRAILDFNFVLKLEPDNLMALFNRALLLDKTGNLKGAIRDYTKVIHRFPNFWTGLLNRAACYRKLGMEKQAELDEFRVYKARLYKHLYGTQPRIDRSQLRRKGDDDMDKYNQIVIADNQDVEPDYKSAYRGKVQNRRVELSFKPMYGLAFEQKHTEVHSYVAFDRQVELFNERTRGTMAVCITSDVSPLDEATSKAYFLLIDTLSASAGKADSKNMALLLLKRAVAYTALQNLDEAVSDLSACIAADSAQTLAYWQRTVCRERQARFLQSQGKEAKLLMVAAISDATEAIRLNQQNPYLYYNRGNLYAAQNDYRLAIEDYSRAIVLDQHLAEAFFNRGLARIKSGMAKEGVADLSKAGELGLYDAYSVIKKYSK